MVNNVNMSNNTSTPDNIDVLYDIENQNMPNDQRHSIHHSVQHTLGKCHSKRY